MSTFLTILGNMNYMSTYGIILRNVNHMTTYEPILRDINHMTLYETILFIINSYVDIWSHIGQSLDSQSRGPVFKTTGWPQDRLSLSSFRGRQNEYQEFLGTKW